MVSPWATLLRGRGRGADARGVTQPAPGRRLPVSTIRLALFASVSLYAVAAPSAHATGAPLWHIRSVAEPTVFSASDEPNNDEYVVSVENIGTAPSSGTIVVTDTLPAGIATSASPTSGGDWACGEGAGQTTVTCESSVVATPASVSYHGSTTFEPGQIEIPVALTSGVTSPGRLTNRVTVSGGGAPATASDSTDNPANVPDASAFGLAHASANIVSSPDGLPYSPAGGHPYALTTDVAFNQELKPGASDAAGELEDYVDAVQGDESRTVVAELPLGLIGNPQATPQCPVSELGGGDNQSRCPANTQVGVVYLDRPGTIGPYALFNLIPEPGHTAEFGITLVLYEIVLYGSVVHTDNGYVLRVTAPQPSPERALGA